MVFMATTCPDYAVKSLRQKAGRGSA